MMRFTCLFLLSIRCLCVDRFLCVILRFTWFSFYSYYSLRYQKMLIYFIWNVSLCLYKLLGHFLSWFRWKRMLCDIWLCVPLLMLLFIFTVPGCSCFLSITCDFSVFSFYACRIVMTTPKKRQAKHVFGFCMSKLLWQAKHDDVFLFLWLW